MCLNNIWILLQSLSRIRSDLTSYHHHLSTIICECEPNLWYRELNNSPSLIPAHDRRITWWTHNICCTIFCFFGFLSASVTSVCTYVHIFKMIVLYHLKVSFFRELSFSIIIIHMKGYVLWQRDWIDSHPIPWPYLRLSETIFYNLRYPFIRYESGYTLPTTEIDRLVSFYDSPATIQFDTINLLHCTVQFHWIVVYVICVSPEWKSQWAYLWPLTLTRYSLCTASTYI